jgi:hypothetical protein
MHVNNLQIINRGKTQANPILVEGIAEDIYLALPQYVP